jgi:hypothetical protein
MSVKNKYVIRSRISEDLSATQISHLTKISRPTVNKYLTAIRLRILELSLLQSNSLVGKVTVEKEWLAKKLLEAI